MNISDDQNTIIIDDQVFEFTMDGETDCFNCDLSPYCVNNQIEAPCCRNFRDDKKTGCFKKQLKINKMSEKEEQLTEEDKKEIDALSHEAMCRHWRFGTGKKIWFDNSHPASGYFKDRLFSHFGGFTPEISKRIGW